MRIQLPFEWWLDVFDQGTQRDDLASISNRTSDSQFSEVMQAWLHRYQRNVKLGSLILKSEMLCSEDGIVTKRGVLYRSSRNETLQDNVDLVRLPIAQVPMPPNITSFRFIDIKYVDATLFEFLQKLRRLFTDVHIQFSHHRIQFLDNEALWLATRRSLHHLLPMFAVKSMHIDNHEDFTFLLEHFPATINDATAICLVCNFQAVPELEPYHNWLQNGRADGEPRLLCGFVPGGLNDVLLFGQRIQERFLASSKAVSYFICFRILVQAGDELVGEVHKNNATGEQLMVSSLLQLHPMEIDDDDEDLRDILYTRCPINADAAWLEPKKRWACEWLPEERIINLQLPIECDLPDDQQQPGPPPEQPGTSGSGGSTTEQQQQQSGPSSASTDEQGPSTSSAATDDD